MASVTTSLNAIVSKSSFFFPKPSCYTQTKIFSRAENSFCGFSSTTLQNNFAISSSNFTGERSRKSSLKHQIKCSYSNGTPNSESEPIDIVADVRNEKILVLGGNGFVGSAICKAAIAQGIEVVSLNRSGPPTYTDPWINEVKWVKGDVFAADWSSVLAGVDTVISCLGGFGTNEQMERICGDATITAVNSVQNTDVEKFIFISVHDYNLPSFLLDSGYFKGKRRAEDEVLAKFPSTGVILRPGFIYGKRKVNNIEIPLDLVGQPLEKVLSLTENITKPLRSLPASDVLLAPPVDVAEVASAVVKAVVDDSIHGIFDISQIKELAAAKKV